MPSTGRMLVEDNEVVMGWCSRVVVASLSRLAFSSPSEAFLLTTSLFVSKFKSPKAVSPYTQHQNNIHNIIAKLETSPSEKDCRRQSQQTKQSLYNIHQHKRNMDTSSTSIFKAVCSVTSNIQTVLINVLGS